METVDNSVKNPAFITIATESSSRVWEALLLLPEALAHIWRLPSHVYAEPHIHCQGFC